MRPHQLIAFWRDQADAIALFYPEEQVKPLRVCAEQLEQALAHEALELLSLPEAARESGYSIDRLGELIREEKLENAGEKGAPRIRRGDLPRKPSRSGPVAMRLSSEHTGAMQQAVNDRLSRR